MPKFIVQVVERWSYYHEVEVEAEDRWEAEDIAKRQLEENSLVNYELASEAGLEYIDMEVIN
jgi:hypothetical protein